MKRVVVTGASGFVGANLARRLVRDGHETHLLLRPSYRPWRLEEIIGDVCLHRIELHDAASVSKSLREIKPDWVFHLAAYGNYPAQKAWPAMLQTNLMGAVALVDACVEIGVEAYVQTGSSSEYGFKDHPTREDEVICPNSHYAVTKAAATHYVQLAARQFELHAVTLRLYSIYGPYEEPCRFIPTLVTHGLSGHLPPLVAPEVGRDFVYVDDAVEAMLAIAALPHLPRGSIYNVCSGKQSTVRSVVALARELLAIDEEPVWSSMESRSWDTNTWVGVPDAIERDAHWRSSTDLRSGLQRIIEWLRQHPEMGDIYSA